MCVRACVRVHNITIRLVSKLYSHTDTVISFLNFRKNKSNNDLLTDKFETTGCRWFIIRLPFDVPRISLIIFVLKSVSHQSDNTFDHLVPIAIAAAALDVIVFTLYLLCRFKCAWSGPIFKEQAKAYLFYSLTLGFPCGTATKILCLLYLHGVTNISRDYIPIPYLIEMAMVTVAIVVRQFSRLVKESSSCRMIAAGVCLLGLLAYVGFFWASAFSLLYHAGFYKNPTSFHTNYWMARLFSVWSIAALAIVYKISSVLLLVWKGKRNAIYCIRKIMHL